MIQQIARRRPAITLKIGRRGGEGRPLNTRSDRDRDHILRQMLAITYAGIAAGRPASVGVTPSSFSSTAECPIAARETGLSR
ncbi:hypothetical protein [Rhizobium sp. 768_B6_N1_8]|uniref:hypothetical protein n=1 Tax=unclassified Rhizobium TaxID=2613769 RepID=UPI003F28350B